MKKTQALDWLNRRLVINRIDQYDIEFIRDYIKHFTNEDVRMDQIIESVKFSHPERLVRIFDSMINKLIVEFNIEFKTVPIAVGISVIFNDFMGKTEKSEKIIEYF